MASGYLRETAPEEPARGRGPARHLLAGGFCAYDCETTGEKADSCHVVELGYARFEGGVLRERRAERFNPGAPIDPAATAVHGITDAEVALCPPLTHCEWLVPLLDETLVGYNSRRFDDRVLQRELVRGRGLLVNLATIDVYVFVAWHLRHLAVRKLGAVAPFLGIRYAGGHDAASDAVATGHVLVRLLRQGLVPVDVAEARAEQERLAALMEDERARWGSAFYRDRTSPWVLRVGRGDRCGQLVEHVPRAYCRDALRAADAADACEVILPSGFGACWRLTPDARTVFEHRARGLSLDRAFVEARASAAPAAAQQQDNDARQVAGASAASMEGTT